MIDSGKNWDQNSIFGPPRIINSKRKTDSLIINSRFGIQAFNKARALYGYGHFTYKNNFHGYLYSRVVNYPDLFERYSGIPRDISRYGFTSGETTNQESVLKMVGLFFNLEGVEKVGELATIYS